MLLREITCETQGGFDVLGLGALVPTGQQNDQLSPSLLEIHPITGAVVDSQLRDTFTNGLDISWVSGSEPFDPCLDARSRLKVAQVVEPLSEEAGFANFNQEATVAAWLHIVNTMRAVLRCPTKGSVLNGTDRHEWRIPAERMKMRTPHLVPLSRQAVTVLSELREMNGAGRLAFPSTTSREKPMSENTILYALYRMGYPGRATGHGFRATASTLLNEMAWRPDVIERQLAHKEANKVRAAYHRSEYLPERRKMMQAWVDYFDKLKAGAGADVIPLRGQAG